MEQPIAVFEPIRSGNYLVVMISLFFVVIAIVFLIYNYNKKVAYENRAYKQLFSLLSFFVIMIAAVTAFFSFWAAQKFTTVKVFPDAIETGFGKVDFGDIHKVYIHNNQQQIPLSGAPKGDVIRILIIEEMDRKTHALSEENYQIDSLIKVLNTLKSIK